ALKSNPQLQLILLLNENPDIPTYKFWQESDVGRLSAMAPGQHGASALWSTTQPDPVQQAHLVQRHVEPQDGNDDDVWASTGMADSRILQYSPAVDAVGQLSGIGVNVRLFNVANAVPK